MFQTTLHQCFQQLFAGKWSGNKLAINLLSRCLEAMPQFLNEFPLPIIMESGVMSSLCRIIDAVAKTSNAQNAPLCLDEFYRFALIAEISFFCRKFVELKKPDPELTQKVSDMFKKTDFQNVLAFSVNKFFSEMLASKFKHFEIFSIFRNVLRFLRML